jgi:nucleoside-diphosphate-sugar epimerase
MVHGPGNKGNLNLLYKFVKTGLPYPLGAFENRRSFLNVDNFNFIIDQFLSRDIPGGIYHLADDGFLSTRSLVRIIGEALGKTPMIWKIPPSIIRPLFSVYDKKKLQKLTEDMVVSNARLVSELGRPLPVSIEEGVRRTVRSFNDVPKL